MIEYMKYPETMMSLPVSKMKKLFLLLLLASILIGCASKNHLAVRQTSSVSAYCRPVKKDYEKILKPFEEEVIRAISNNDIKLLQSLDKYEEQFHRFLYHFLQDSMVAFGQNNSYQTVLGSLQL